MLGAGAEGPLRGGGGVCTKGVAVNIAEREGTFVTRGKRGQRALRHAGGREAGREADDAKGDFLLLQQAASFLRQQKAINFFLLRPTVPPLSRARGAFCRAGSFTAPLFEKDRDQVGRASHRIAHVMRGMEMDADC